MTPNVEVDERVAQTRAVADAFAVMAHRTDSAEHLIAGLRHAGGPDLGPRQACHLQVTLMLVSSAAHRRPLTMGDVIFTYEMLSPLLPDWSSHDDAAWFLAELSPLAPADIRQMRVMLDEMGLMARSQSDLESSELLENGTDALLRESDGGWTDPRNYAQLDLIDHRVRQEPDQAGTSAAGGGCLILILAALVLLGVTTAVL